MGDEVTMECDVYLKSTNAFLLKVTIVDTFFYDLTTFTELGYTLQAFCGPNANDTYDPKFTKMLELENLKLRLNAGRTQNTGTGPPPPQPIEVYSNGWSQEDYIEKFGGDLNIICHIILGVVTGIIMGIILVLIILHKKYDGYAQNTLSYADLVKSRTQNFLVKAYTYTVAKENDLNLGTFLPPPFEKDNKNIVIDKMVIESQNEDEEENDDDDDHNGNSLSYDSEKLIRFPIIILIITL